MVSFCEIRCAEILHLLAIVIRIYGCGKTFEKHGLVLILNVFQKELLQIKLFLRELLQILVFLKEPSQRASFPRELSHLELFHWELSH